MTEETFEEMCDFLRRKLTATGVVLGIILGGILGVFAYDVFYLEEWWVSALCLPAILIIHFAVDRVRLVEEAMWSVIDDVTDFMEKKNQTKTDK
jgi:galactitol-specific phosphotransferase system IIC component